MEVTKRYTNPTRYDNAPYGTVYQNGDEIFIQVSQNQDQAEWLTLGDFFVKVLGGCDLSNESIKEYLDIYENKIIKPERF